MARSGNSIKIDPSRFHKKSHRGEYQHHRVHFSCEFSMEASWQDKEARTTSASRPCRIQDKPPLKIKSHLRAPLRYLMFSWSIFILSLATLARSAVQTSSTPTLPLPGGTLPTPFVGSTITQCVRSCESDAADANHCESAWVEICIQYPLCVWTYTSRPEVHAFA